MTSKTHKYANVPHRVWQGLTCPEPPCEANSLEDIAAQAKKMLAQREKNFPAMVQRGQLSADEAQAQIAIWRSIAADWHWIITGEGEPADKLTVFERRDAIDASLRTLAEIYAENHGLDDATAHQANLVIAMRWHIDPERGFNDIYMHCRLTRESDPTRKITSYRYFPPYQEKSA